MVKKVIHLADLHIPNSIDDKPYNEMLKKLVVDILLDVKGLKKDEVRIVLVGDIYHHKIKVTNEAKTVFHDFMNMLNSVAKTIIVAGNHDMLENNTDRMDSLTPTFEIKGVYENITYLDKNLGYKSGYLVDENVIWVLYSMFDKFAKPNIDGLREQYPEHKIIGLYHGDIAGSVTDSGWVSESGIDTNVFSDCDCVMAGHIHKHQEIKKNGVPIVYAGSTFQVNFGENITGHGFVSWDLDDMEYKLHEVDNKHRMLKFEIDSYDDVKDDKERLLNL